MHKKQPEIQKIKIVPFVLWTAPQYARLGGWIELQIIQYMKALLF